MAGSRVVFLVDGRIESHLPRLTRVVGERVALGHDDDREVLLPGVPLLELLARLLDGVLRRILLEDVPRLALVARLGIDPF